MKTKKQALKWILNTIGQGIDWDKMYGFQCMDLAVAYLYYVTDGKIAMWGNAIDAPKNNFKGTAKVIKNYPAFRPEAGDIVVWSYGNFSTYGHIAVVIDGDPYGDLQYITVAEQNWNGLGLYKQEVTTKRIHNYDGVSHFIRPKFKKTAKKEDNTPTKEKNNKKTKGKKLKVSTQRINYTMDKRGYKPKFVVIHNDAGSSSAQQYEQGLKNAGYSRYAQGVAHAYASDGYVWEAISEDRIAWHTGDGTNPGTGNFEGYGIEVCQSLGDRNTFLKNEQTVFQFIAEKLQKWNLPANRNTIRLHNEFIQTECPHASAYYHAGMNTKVDAYTKERQLKIKDYFIKQIRAYMKGSTPKSTVVKSSKSSGSLPKKKGKKQTSKSNIGKTFDFNGLSTNVWGTKWYYENNTFTCNARQGIITRVGSPFTTAPQAGVLFYGQTVTYNQVAVNPKEPFVWISWITNNGTEVWMPIEVLDSNNKIIEQWGTLGW